MEKSRAFAIIDELAAAAERRVALFDFERLEELRAIVARLEPQSVAEYYWSQAVAG